MKNLSDLNRPHHRPPDPIGNVIDLRTAEAAALADISLSAPFLRESTRPEIAPFRSRSHEPPTQPQDIRGDNRAP